MQKLIKILKYKVFLTIGLLPLIGRAQTTPPEPTAFEPAENNFGLEDAAQGTGVIRERPTDIAVFIINALFGLLGTVFAVLIILGGFKWMTSGGNKDKVQEARELIRNAAVGLAIVLVAYAVSRFILSMLRKEGVGPGATSS
ncbi:hypothetical protein C0580_04370 [Candidatus Parcubacteria bacterium]|nr:MAG: hypothetical protein C0580_04370 [Candidatus Parcubacteria bacterium]